MRKAIDLECDLPPDENGKARKTEEATHPPGFGDPERLPPQPGHGFSNYERIFTRRSDSLPSPEPRVGGCVPSTRSGDAEAGPIHTRTSTGTSGSYV
jgi:hypothetical protein